MKRPNIEQILKVQEQLKRIYGPSKHKWNPEIYELCLYVLKLENSDRKVTK